MKNKLMILGPTAIEKEILDIGSLPQVYMRTSEFSLRLESIFRNLQYVFQTKNPVLIFASSGTGVMDAAVSNFFSAEDTVIVINGGSFGKRWEDICQNYRINIIEISVEFGESVNPKDVIHVLEENPHVKGIFATHDETSSGALTDIQEIGKGIYEYSVQNNRAKPLFIVDAVSSLIVEEIKTDDWYIDIIISASQKALALPPGLGFMAVSDAAIKKAQAIESRPFYFDVLEHIENWKRNQTPFTPAVGIIFQLERRLEKIKEMGLEAVQKHYSDLTIYLRNSLNTIGISVFARKPANAVTGVMLENFDAPLLVKRLSMEYHIDVAPSGGELEKKFVRIGNFGDIQKQDIDILCKGIQNILENHG